MASGVSRFIRGKQPDKDLILDKIDQQKRKANEAHEQDQAALKMLLDRERKQAAQIQDQRAEMDVLQKQLDAQKLNEAQLRRALSLGADRLAKAQQVELELRRELEEQGTTIHNYQMEVQDLTYRLRDEKGVGPQLKFVRKLQLAAKMRPAKDLLGDASADKPFTSIAAIPQPGAAGLAPVEGRGPQAALLAPFSGAGGGGGGAGAMGAAAAGGAADVRLRREQTKRLLHFLKGRLGQDLEAWKAAGSAPGPQSDAIGTRRALVASLEATLQVTGTPGTDGGAGVGSSGDTGAKGVTMQIRGETLPRSLAMNESSISPLLFTSGPAAKWSLKAPQADKEIEEKAAAEAAAAAAAKGAKGGAAAGKAGAKGGAAAKKGAAAAKGGAAAAKGGKAGAGAADGPSETRWQAGRRLTVVASAKDATDELDSDLDTVVLLEGPEDVEGCGLVRVVAGKAEVPLMCTRSGPVTLMMYDGGFSSMAPPQPLTVEFFGGPATSVTFAIATDDKAPLVAAAAAAPARGGKPGAAAAGGGAGAKDGGPPMTLAGKEVKVWVRLVDQHGNTSPEVAEAVVDVRCSHDATGGGLVQLADGEGSIMLCSQVAGRVEVSAAGVEGSPRALDLSRRLLVPFGSGDPSTVAIRLSPTAKALAGELTRLQVFAADAHGNPAPKSVGGEVVVAARPPATVERGGAVTIVDGEGEVWVRSEDDVSMFYLLPGTMPQGLTALHTEQNPFELRCEAGAVRQLGLYAGSAAPTVVGAPMTVHVRTEDQWGNATTAPNRWAGRVLVRCSGRARGAGEVEVELRDGAGSLQLESDYNETIQLSLHDVADCGLRVTGPHSELRARFSAMAAARAVFGLTPPVPPQPAGVPLQLPLQVLDRNGNVCTDFKADVKVTIGAGARVAGGGKPVFKVLNGRALLPVMCTAVQTVSFALGDDAVFDAEAAAASSALRRYPDAIEVDFEAGEVRTLQLRASSANTGEPNPSKLSAGDELVLAVKALDAHDNVCTRQHVTLFLEASLVPQLDETLSTASQRPREPPQRYMLALTNGVATERVPTRVAGELTVKMVQPSPPTADASGQVRVKVTPGKATSVDVLNIPEAGQAGQAFELVCAARDKYGNIDDTFEKEVALDYDGHLPGGDSLTLPNNGVLNLKKGVARVRVARTAKVG